MFGLFKRRTAASSVAALHFKSTAAAFQFACENFENRLDNEAQIPAIVLHINEAGSCVVKVANAHDSSLPSGPIRAFLETGNIDFVSVRTIIPDNVGQLQVHDLVSFLRPNELKEAPVLLGVVTARLLPQFDPNRGWKIAGPR
jgi:hypothetical protein